MNKNPLGKKIKGKSTYDKNLLFFIPRKTLRIKNKINEKIINGFDVWNAYEFSFLNQNGVPQNYLLRIIYPADSINIVESKSLKLYLYSFSMTKFNDLSDVKSIIINDLKKGLITNDIKADFYDHNKKIKFTKIPKKLLLDNLNITTDVYKTDAGLLKINQKSEIQNMKHYSNNLKTNCPITGQPDWATVFINYKSRTIIEPESLSKYIISYRNHNDYHESCCENIFNDLFNVLNPFFLIIKCFYTRRGGIDINPVRFYGKKINNDFDFHFWRQ